MATPLKRAVGSRARNTRSDVVAVQKLLNKWADKIGLVKPLTEDGLVGRQTMLAIIEFQGRVVGMVHPDGRIDPGGTTWRVLNQGTVKFKLLAGEGPGYYAYGESKKRHGTAATLASIKRVARALKADGIEVGVGNLSLGSGGPMSPHSSHQRGVDVDFRPLRGDGKRSPTTIHKPEYSREMTRLLVKALRADDNLDVILFNDPVIPGIVEWTGHDNHLHVRFKA